MAATCARPRAAEPFGQPAIVHQARERGRHGRRRRLAHEPAVAVAHELGRAAAVASTSRRLCPTRTPRPSRTRSLRAAAQSRRRGTVRGAATSASSSRRPVKVTRPPTPSDSASASQVRHGSPPRRRSTTRTWRAAGSASARIRRSRRLVRRQPRDGQDVVAVLVAPVRARRRRRPQAHPPGRPGRRAAGAGSCATARRLRVVAVAQQPPVRHVDQGLAGRAPSRAPCARNRRRKLGPQVVVLAHRVVEPAHVRRVADGVARIAEADDLITWSKRATFGDQFARYVANVRPKP